MDEKERRTLLDESSRDSRDFDEEEQHLNHAPKKNSLGLSLCVAWSLIALFASVTLNVIMALRLSHTVDTGRSPYSGLSWDTPATYRAMTEYSSPNHTLAEELWRSIDISQATVAIDRSWAAHKGLPPSNVFPWDNDKDLFTIRGVHDMHCLKMLRFGLSNIERAGTPHVAFDHLYHCLDGLRQGVMCRADDTPLRSFQDRDHSVGADQPIMCRSWDKMIAWASAPERDACWSMIDDYKPIKHKLERFAYCKKDSPYYDTMRRYFELHGHKEPFAADYADT